MFTCKVCGKTFEGSPSYVGNICGNECFHKNFWKEHLDDSAVIIKGVCYHIGSEEGHLGFKGFDGTPYTIQFNDGRVVHTTCLWCNGKIPKEFHREDNARFI